MASRDNPFRHAYAALGGTEAAEVTHRIEGEDGSSVLYLWADPSVLVED